MPVSLESLDEFRKNKGIRAIIDEFYLGKTLEQVCEKFKGIYSWEVKKIYEQAKIKDYSEKRNAEINKRIFKEKVPKLKELAQMGIEILEKSLKEILASDKLRREVALNVKDLKSLESLITGLNNHVRLEEGKSTVNLETHSSSYQETKIVLQELAKIDPVFEYVQLPAPETKLIDDKPG